MQSDNNQVNQRISGKKHQIAGRDIINEGDGFCPDPNNPNLKTCFCGYECLGIGADTCPKCHHNHLADRLAAQAEAEQRTKKFLAFIGIGLLFVFYFADSLARLTGMNLLESAAAIIVGCLVRNLSFR